MLLFFPNTQIAPSCNAILVDFAKGTLSTSTRQHSIKPHPLTNAAAFWLQLRADDRPPHVVSVLMQELSTNEETEWVAHLVGEMVDGVGHLRQSADAMNILKESLALPCLDEEFVEEQLGVSADLLLQDSIKGLYHDVHLLYWVILHVLALLPIV